MNYTALALGLAGLYLVTMALVTITKNFTSSLVFKVIPFLIGMLNLVIVLRIMGLV